MRPGPDWWYWLCVRVVRHLAVPLLGGWRVRGAERVPAEGPVLIACNHLSFLDPPIVGSACPRRVGFMAKKELFDVPGFGRLIASLGAFPVRRGETDSHALRRAVELLESGGTLMLFPEGTRGDGTRLLPIAPGIALLAKRTGAAVVPTAVAGTEKAWPRGRKWPRRASFTVLFGEPFRYSDFETGRSGSGAREAFLAELRARMVALAREAGLPLIDESCTTGRTADRTGDAPIESSVSASVESPGPP